MRVWTQQDFSNLKFNFKLLLEFPFLSTYNQNIKYQEYRFQIHSEKDFQRQNV